MSTNQDRNQLMSQSLLTANAHVQRIESENMKSMKSLYEHQIDMLKVKIAMLEKTCANYQQGIKEMNKSSGFQQQSEGIASIQSFKEVMQQIQKANAELETERIDLQVKCSKLKEEVDQVRMEKENLFKKFTTVDQHNQRLLAERSELETNNMRQLEAKQHELNETKSENTTLRNELIETQLANENLKLQLSDHEQLITNHEQLSKQYEQLYVQASEIASEKEQLKEDAKFNKSLIDELKLNLSESQMKINHLETKNSDLNTSNVNFEMKLAAMTEKEEEYLVGMAELVKLKAEKLDVDKLQKQVREMEVEMMEKNELVDQMNQAKEFLAENNSLLLTNNMKLMLFLESLGIDQTQIETRATVREYEQMRKKQKEDGYKLSELKKGNKKLD